MAEEMYRDKHAAWADEVLEELISWEDIKKELADLFIEAFKLENSERYIRARFKKDDALSWKNALRTVVNDIHQAKHTDTLKDAVRQKLRESLKGEDEEE